MKVIDLRVVSLALAQIGYKIYTMRIRNVGGVGITYTLRCQGQKELHNNFCCETLHETSPTHTYPTHRVAKGLNWNLMCTENAKLIVLKSV